MKVPISWLKEYVTFEDTVQGLADKLTFSGIEVEGIETIGSSFEGLVVGEVREVNAHPNADRLTVCRVFDGQDEVQVVCGAPNVRADAKIPFAPIGSALPDGAKMKRAKIRQVESFGMLLAEDELGLSDNHEGVVILEDRWPAGTPLAEVFGPPETVLDLEITPNRPDCLSLIGVAREVAALYRTRLKIPGEGSIPTTQETTSDASVDVVVEDTQSCPRYMARVVTGITIGPSPSWMQRRLTHAGVRPINNVVDITNYVMLETGHPLHAFDLVSIQNNKIVVRKARADEKMNTLDGAERALDASMLVIADAERPVAVAGVMGGEGSEISDATTSVLLEAAAFDPLSIRATSRALGLSTESSYRFERGVDPAGVAYASQRATALLVEFAGGRVAGETRDCYPTPLQPTQLTCRFDYIRTVTGMDLSADVIEQLLTSIGLAVESRDEKQLQVRIPTFRRDVEREVDLVEEVARLHGLEHVPTPQPSARLVAGATDHVRQAKMEVTTRLVGLGFREIMNYSLTSPALLDIFDANNAATRIVMPNPISADQSVLRTSLIPQLTETIGRNHARQAPEAQLFECGRIYIRDQHGEPTEHERISLGVLGPVGRSPFDKRRAIEPREMFLWLKGMIAALVESQRLTDWDVEPLDHPYFEPGQAARLMIESQDAGIFGLLRNRIRKEWRLSGPVAVAELSMPVLLSRMDVLVQARPAPVYPAIVRDMALVVDQSTTHQDILAIIQNAAPQELENVELFDIFESDAIGAGHKSMAYSITYRSAARTLTDDETNVYHERVKEAIKSGLASVVVREG